MTGRDSSITSLLSAVEGALRDLGVPQKMIKEAINLLPADVLGVVVYGSRARGDAIEGSDLDLLALVGERRRTMNRNNVSLSFYTDEQLSHGVGSLFGAHLRRDGRIIFDPSGKVASAISKLTPVNGAKLLRRVHYFSTILSALEYDLPKYLPGLLRIGRYLLRSALYAKTAAEGRECFSVRELAVRYRDPALTNLLASRPSHEGTREELAEILHRLERIIGQLRNNPHGSLEALIINEWNPASELVAMAMMALGGTSSELDYAEVRKVLL